MHRKIENNPDSTEAMSTGHIDESGFRNIPCPHQGERV